MQASNFLFAGNFLLCLVIAIMCILRIGSEIAHQHFSAWLAYTAVLIAAGASGLQPIWWGNFPTPGNLAQSAAIVIVLLVLRHHHDTAH